MRREAEEAAKSQPAAPPVSPPGAALPATITPSYLPAFTRPAQEVLPPLAKDEDVTRTAFRRAMRKVAQQHAAKAIEVLAKNMESLNPEIAGKAANDVLKWSGLDKIELEAGAEGLHIAIIRFKDTEES
jgi:hypothetical protein